MLRRESFQRLPAVLLLLGTGTVFAADQPPIARVGSKTVSAAALTRRLARMPDFQRAALGDTPEALKRRVLDSELIPEFLYAEEAERLKLGEQPGFRKRQRELLRDALDRSLRRGTLAEKPVTAEDIRAYFEANRSRFETPQRLRVWRILVNDEAMAKKIIAECQGTTGVQRWSDFAREQSLDKATHLRNGDLGFIHPDGDTDTPTLRVDPSLFTAAAQLKDGELGLSPVKEGLHYAVLWRRGSLKPVVRTQLQEEGSIRQVLERQRLQAARDALLVELRSKYVSAQDESPLDSFKFDVAEAATPPAALRSPHPAAAGSSPPTAGERGER